MSTRPELQAPPEIFYNDSEALKYTSSSRIVEIQAKLSERALELLALPDDDVPRFLLDIDVAVEREVEGDLLLGDMGQGMGLRAGVIDGAISISAVQWLCNADKSSHEPRLRLKAFFASLYRCLSRGAMAVFQIYAENIAQRELIFCQAMRAGFSGWFVLDYPHSTKKRKEFLVVICGPLPTNIDYGHKDSFSDDDDSEDDEENGMVWVSSRNRPRKMQRTNKNGKRREWVLRKKEQSRRKGNDVPADSKYTARKREEMAARTRPAAAKPEFEVAACDQKDNSALLKKQYNLRFLPRQGKVYKKTEHCVICLDDVDSDLKFYVERCGHRFCINCVKQHIEVKLVDGKTPNCPHHGCVFHLSIDRCGDLLTFNERSVWMQRIKENSIPLAERVYCPYESCSHLMSMTELSRRGSYSGFGRCFKCHGDICFHCRVPWHFNLSCNDYKRLFPSKYREDGVDDAKLKSLASLNGWRQCPKCYHMVGRSYGCNRITCRCGNAFCYKCGYLWRRLQPRVHF